MTDTEKLAKELDSLIAKGAMGHDEALSMLVQADALETAKKLAIAMQALQAVVAWFDAEDQHTGSFHDKVELCNYAEWMSRKALGQNVDEYKPVPRIIIDFGGLHRGD